jgi:hypothetical protein
MISDNQEEESVYLISEKQLRVLIASRVGDLNKTARVRGEKERVSGSELLDLYYKQKGRCAITGWPLKKLKNGRRSHDEIELDHIEEINGGTSRRWLALDGDKQKHPPGGRAADINNLQWVCRFANQLKQRCRAAGVSLEGVAQSVLSQAEQGWPIRKNCTNLGLKGARAFREKFLTELSLSKPGVSAAQAAALLQGTPGETHQAVVLKQMHELGLVQTSWPKRRQEVLRALASNDDLVFDCLEEFTAKANSLLGHHKGFTSTSWKEDAKTVGVVITLRKTRPSEKRRRICAGDRAACVNVLREAADDGLLLDELVSAAESRGVPSHLVSDAIEAVIEAFAAYENQGRLFASLTREEAADRIGVSKNRLKKWARGDWHDPLAGPEFMKDTSKSLTYYKRHVVDSFVKSRGKHCLDLAEAGQRVGCVNGGRLGGRSPKTAPGSQPQKVLPNF